MGAAAKEDGKGGGVEKKKKQDAPVAGEGAAAPPSVTVVFQFDMHCAGCAKKVKRAVAGFQGVQQVSAESTSGRLTVSGQIDPNRLRELVEAKMHKRVNLVSVSGTPPTRPQPSPPPPTTTEVKQPSPQPPPQKPAAPAPPPPAADGAKEVKDKGAAAAAPDGGGEEKKATKTEGDEKPKTTPKAAAPPAAAAAPAAAAGSTMVIRMRLHCDDCIDRLRRRILRFKGVQDVHIDAHKELVTVKGTMDAYTLPTYLKEKTGRSVEVVAPASGKDGSGGEKKDKDGEAAGGDGGGDKKPPKDQAKQQEQEHRPPPPAVLSATANKMMQSRGIGGEVAYAQPPSQAVAYASYGGGGENTPYAYPYNPSSSYASYASPPPQQQQHQYAYSSYPYSGPEPAGPSSVPVAYPPYGSSGGGSFYPGAATPVPPGTGGPGPYGYLSQAPQFFSDENPNGCSVM